MCSPPEWHDHAVPFVKRTTRVLLPLCTRVLLPVAACSSQQPPTGQQQPVVETRGPAGAVPAGLEKFYGQPLSWGECAPYATSPDAKSAFSSVALQCARLTVPLDYTKPTGDTITIGVLRRKASDTANRIGALVVNPGGPGASGMAAAANLASQVSGNDLGRRLDLVG